MHMSKSVIFAVVVVLTIVLVGGIAVLVAARSRPSPELFNRAKNTSPQDFDRFIDWWFSHTLSEVKAARGDMAATRAAWIHCFQRGYRAGMSLEEVMGHLPESSFAEHSIPTMKRAKSSRCSRHLHQGRSSPSQQNRIEIICTNRLTSAVEWTPGRRSVCMSGVRGPAPLTASVGSYVTAKKETNPSGFGPGRPVCGYFAFVFRDARRDLAASISLIRRLHQRFWRPEVDGRFRRQQPIESGRKTVGRSLFGKPPFRQRLIPHELELGVGLRLPHLRQLPETRPDRAIDDHRNTGQR